MFDSRIYSWFRFTLATLVIDFDVAVDDGSSISDCPASACSWRVALCNDELIDDTTLELGQQMSECVHEMVIREGGRERMEERKAQVTRDTVMWSRRTCAFTHVCVCTCTDV